MTKAEIERALLSFVADELLDGDAEGLTVQTPLLELGVIDSLSIVSLLSFVETTCGVSVPSERVRPETFANIEAIAKLSLSLLDTSKAS